MKTFTIRNKTIDGPLSAELVEQLSEREDSDEEYVYAAMRLIKKRDAEIERLRLGIAAASQWIACHGEHGGGPEGVLAIRQVLDNFTVEQAAPKKETFVSTTLNPLTGLPNTFEK